MDKQLEIEYLEIEEKKEYEKLIEDVIKQCFIEEKLSCNDFYVNIILTNAKNIREINKKYRNIDESTDVLSFPMFEKDEIKRISIGIKEVLGDIVISIERVIEQAKEYGHSFERELAYMVVHGFYHIMGEDHLEEKDKQQMREKEEKILHTLNLERI